jgi:hypothetical protein
MTTGPDHLVGPWRRIPGLPVSSRGTADTIGLVATLGLAAGCCVVAVRQMRGMDMGVATELGSFVMLPGVAAAVVSRATDGVRCRESFGSGLGFGLRCVGSSIGLMARHRRWHEPTNLFRGERRRQHSD